MNDIAKKQETKRATPAPLATGGDLGAFVPQTFEQAWRLSDALANGASNMIPDAYRNNPGGVFAAIAKGAEIGLTPMAALGSIAVVNGRPSLWGDALPALVRRFGHQLHEEVKGEGNNMVAVATLTRADTGEKVKRSFSVDDAQKAGLWGKKGPWQQYPKRMLQMRARGFACRDGAADALLGLAVCEEVEDAAKIRDITPDAKPAARIEPPSADALTTTAQATTEPEPEKDEAELTPDFAQIASRIEEDVCNAESLTDIDDVLLLYTVATDELQKSAPGEWEKLNDAIERRKNELEAGSSEVTETTAPDA